MNHQVGIRRLLHKQILVSMVIGIVAFVSSFLMNPYVEHLPLIEFSLISLILGGITYVNTKIWYTFTAHRVLGFAYILTMSLGFRLQLGAMADARFYWSIAVAIEIIMTTALVFNYRRDYFLSSLLVIGCVFVAEDARFFEAVSTPLLGIALSSALLLGLMVHHMFMLAMQNMSEAKENFRILSHTDTLTSLNNRRAFMQIMEQALSRRSLTRVHFCMIDIDNFKRINDRYGHHVGDLVLMAMARALKQHLPSDAVGRLGGEEFGVVLQGFSDANALARIQSLLSAVNELEVEGVRFGFSAGIVTLTDDEDLTTVLTRADQALYMAKEAGKACIVQG
ncbi:GGDEF domain-containing protein [uncultured Oxalicibacterium sp.]|uniref:GGDEF domain-containing protein n=1 Tax=uncultured Oxalicibacterium sp. TaxID=1168540 RepID=UPI0025F580A0|nr:GGDEF domain-containing protein [uncultured Oxalicibacterium sp.]